MSADIPGLDESVPMFSQVIETRAGDGAVVLPEDPAHLSSAQRVFVYRFVQLAQLACEINLGEIPEDMEAMTH